MPLTFTIPGRGVSANRNWRGSTGEAKPYASRETRDEKKRIKAYVFQAAVAVKWQPIKWFATEITIWNGLQDLDNSLKVLLDAMAGAAVQNDRYHLETHTRKRWDDDGPRIEVTVREVDPRDYGRSAERAAAPRSRDAAARHVGCVAHGGRPLLPPMVARNLDRARPLPRVSRRPAPG